MPRSPTAPSSNARSSTLASPDANSSAARFDGCTYAALVVEGGDWSLVALPGADLRKATFTEVRMREADLTGARFDEAILRDVDLSGALLHRTSFIGTDLRGSDLSTLDPVNAEIAGAQIDYEQATVIAETLGFRVGRSGHIGSRVRPPPDAAAAGPRNRGYPPPLADEVLPLWRAVQVETGDPDAALPYWAFAWGGGLAIARYLADHPEAVAGRRVVDFASGSGLCAVAALRAGASELTAIDIDPLAAAAIDLNARANGVRASVVRRDVLDDEPPETDVVIAGDCWYEADLARRVLPWLRRVRDSGIDVIVGDPGRRYLPSADLVEVARYEVRTTTELEDLDHKEGRVYRLRP